MDGMSEHTNAEAARAVDDDEVLRAEDPDFSPSLYRRRIPLLRAYAIGLMRTNRAHAVGRDLLNILEGRPPA
jgi:hypothetical protein